MSYAQISKTAGARKFIEDRERALAAAAAIKRADGRLETSRLWLGEYLARPRRSSFRWEPRFPFKRPETIDGQVSESYPLLTDQSTSHDQSEAQAILGNHEEGVGDAAQERSAPSLSGGPDAASDLRGQGGPQQDTGVGGFDTPF